MMNKEIQVAAPETELLLREPPTIEGKLSTPIITFLSHHTNLVLTLVCMTFAMLPLLMKVKPPQITVR